MRTFVLLFGGTLTLAAACGGRTTATGPGTGGGDGGGSEGGCPVSIPAGPSCSADSTIACSGGIIGFLCAAGVDPELDDPSYSCSIATMTCDDPCTCERLYCCVMVSALGLPSSCTSDNTLACPSGPDSYGYQCDQGEDPSAVDHSLHCGTPTPDPDGVHDDFCCTYD